MKYRLNPQYAHFKDDLIGVASHFDASSHSIHKARNELRIATMQGTKVVIKAFKVPHFINRFAYTFLRDGKAKKSFQNALRLQRLGVPTPAPVGYIEFFSGGLLAQSYFLSLYSPYDFTIREAFHHKIEDHREVISAFAAFTYGLHQKGVWHVDYSPGNILITRESDGYRFSLVDINRMRFAPVSGYEGLANFSKFWAKEEDLRLMARTYAELAGLDAKRAEAVALEQERKLRKKTEFKRRLKSKR